MSNALVYQDETSDLYALMEAQAELAADDSTSASDRDRAAGAVVEYLHNLPIPSRVDRLCDTWGYAEARINSGEAEQLRIKQWVANAKAVRDRVQSRALYALQDMGLRRIDGYHSSLILATNPASVDFTDETMVPPEYRRVTVTLRMDLDQYHRLIELSREHGFGEIMNEAGKTAKTETNRAAIAKVLKAGDGVPGAFLVQNMRAVRK